MKKFLSIVFLITLCHFSLAESLLDSINSRINIKDYQAAIIMCKEVIRSSKNLHHIGEAYFSMGFCYKKTNRTLDAVTAYLQALKYYQDKGYKASVYTNLGNIYFSASMYEEANEFYSYSDSLESDPYFKAKTLLNRAFANRKLKLYKHGTLDAQIALSIADSLSNNNLKFRALNELGLLKKDEGYLEEAIDYFLKANLTYPKKNTFINLGNSYSMIGEKEIAVKYFTKAIAQSNTKNTFRAHQNLANLYYKQNNIDSAMYHFQRAEELFPLISSPDLEFIKLFEQIVMLHKVTDNKDQALIAYEKLTQLLFEFNFTSQALRESYEQKAITKTKVAFDLSELKQEERRIFQWRLYSTLVISLCLLGFLWYRKHRVLKRYLLNQVRSKELKSKINSAYRRYPTS
ncbi:MAG: tetratricopeptide repeat protein [Cyclobacteriaceae bacterium]